jgi:hypothetical protein
MDAVNLFEDSISWLRENYGNFRFFAERDIVWTLQTHIMAKIAADEPTYRIYHNFTILPGKTVDLAIFKPDNSVALVAEFKYEPAHSRKFKDIQTTKFPVVFWDEGVGKDMERIQDFVSKGKTESAYLLFIDEGGSFRWREPFTGSKWVDWENGISVLWSKIERPKQK